MANDLKGTITFSINPDYNQEVSDTRYVIPQIDYKFDFDQKNGLDLSLEEIEFHYNKWLRSLGYDIPASDFEVFKDEDVEDGEYDEYVHNITEEANDGQ